jgi:hypothetical protein
MRVDAQAMAVGGDARVRGMFEYLLAQSAVPVLRMTQHWLYSGTIGAATILSCADRLAAPAAAQPIIGRLFGAARNRFSRFRSAPRIMWACAGLRFESSSLLRPK